MRKFLLCLLMLAGSGQDVPAQTQIKSAWLRGVVHPAESTPADRGKTCTATQMGNPCAQGGVATLGAAVPGADAGMANPVDRRSGNKNQRDTDMPALDGLPGLELVRHYNAMDPRTGTLGRGWGWSYDTRLYWVDGQIQVVQADGSRVAFVCGVGQGPASRCQGRELQRGAIERRGAGWRWNWPTGKQLDFDGHGLLVAVHQDRRLALTIRRHVLPDSLFGAILEVIGDRPHARLRFFYAQRDTQGRLTGVDTPLGHFSYEHAHPDGGSPRLARVTRPDGMERRYHYEPSLQSGHSDGLTGISLASAGGAQVERTHTWRYDAAGRANLFVPGPLEHPVGRIEIVFDEADLGLRVKRDQNQQIREIAMHAPGWPDLRMAFDRRGAMTQWTARGVGPERRRADDRGRLLQRDFAGQGSWNWQRDRHGRVMTMRAESRHAQSSVTQIAWKGMRPTVIQHPEERQIWRYNRRGELREREIVRTARPSRPGWTYRERFGYNARGQRSVHGLPEGGTLQYSWSGANRILAIEWEDARGDRHPILSTVAAGIRHGNGLITAGVRSAAGLEHLAVYQPVTGLALYRHQLGFDVRGDIVRERVQLGAGRQKVSYTLDHARRMTGVRAILTDLTSPQAPHRSLAGFDLAWRPSGQAGALRTHGGLLQPDIMRDATGLPTRAGPFLLQYSALRRLIRVVDSRDPGRTVRYAHNAFGERIGRVDGDTAVQYLFDQNKVAAEAVVSGHRTRVVRRYVYAHEVPVAVIEYGEPGQAAQLFLIHADPVGQPRLMTDLLQRVRWQGQFSPTGELLTWRGDRPLSLRLPGQFADPLTGWHDNYQRTYDPRWGHYLEPDPLGPIPGNSLFGYADQQPRRHADPLGLMLFAFDGTGNRPTSQTNVWLFAQGYREGPVHYIPGPGTAQTMTATDRAWDSAVAWSGSMRADKQWERLLNALANRQETTRAMPLDVVGFSRGAALARDFGSRVAEHVRDGRFWARHPLHGTVSTCVDLRFMGLFDTVAQFDALGSGNAAFNLAISPAWKWVAHAVALHEHRWLFPLTSAGAGGNVIERAFVGAHADIGGGYLTPSASPGSTPGHLSHVALAWMQWQARAAGLAGMPLQARPSVNRPIIHDERAVFARRIQNGDRRVDHADGTVKANYQSFVAAMGHGLRKEVEAFILRGPHPLLSQSDAVGLVDMTGYAAWLRQSMGFVW